MNKIIKIYLTLLFFSFVFTNTKELYVYSGDDAISLSPKKSSKRIDFIEKTYLTADEDAIKKRSHKRRRKVRKC